jgi:hypothetical protein
MAITFSTGTINQPDAGSVGLAMVEKIRDDVIAHPAWDLVEEFTPASGTVRWYVFRCLAAQSDLPNDFCVVIGRLLGSGELRMYLCEDYTLATHTMAFYPSYQTVSGSSTLYDSFGRNSAATVILGTTFPGASGVNPRFQAWVPSGVSSKYWVVVDNDGFSVAFNGASNGYFHVGAYTWLGDTPNPMPILLLGSDSSQGFITRNPAVAGISTSAWGAMSVTGGGGTGSLGTPLGFMGRLDQNDKVNANQRAVAEIGIIGYDNNQPTTIPVAGWAFGKQKRMRAGMSGTAPGGIAFGDAYVYQGRLWVPYLPTDYRIWDTGIAS